MTANKQDAAGKIKYRKLKETCENCAFTRPINEEYGTCDDCVERILTMDWEMAERKLLGFQKARRK